MSDPSHYVRGDTVTEIARSAGIADMLTEAQWESLVVAIAESRENYDLTLVHCLLVDAAGDKSSPGHYENIAEVGRLFRKWVNEWRKVSPTVRNEAANIIGFDIDARSTRMRAKLRYAAGACEDYVAEYGSPKSRPRKTKSRPDRDSIHLDPLRAVLVRMKKWWTEEFSKDWSPKYGRRLDDYGNEFLEPLNSETKLFCATIRACDDLILGGVEPPDGTVAPRHDEQDCASALAIPEPRPSWVSDDSSWEN